MIGPSSWLDVVPHCRHRTSRIWAIVESPPAAARSRVCRSVDETEGTLTLFWGLLDEFGACA